MTLLYKVWRSHGPNNINSSCLIAEVKEQKKKRQGSPKTPSGSPPHPPPPPPPPARSLWNFRSLWRFWAPTKTVAQQNIQLYMTDTRIKPSISPIPKELHMGDDTTVDEQAYSSSGEDIGRDHIPTVNLRKIQNGRNATNFSPDQGGRCNPRYNVSNPLPLGGDPGHVIKQPDFFFNKDLEYLWYGRKIGRPTLSISKMKAAYYPDVGLEQMVPDQMWIEEECKYDIAAMYGISHWWFQRQRFYIDRHTSEGDRRAVRTHMCILSVVRIEVFPMYRYNYMKKIVLRRADLKEYVIAERNYKYLYPIDFEDLLQLGMRLPRLQLNLTKPRWDAKGFEYKHDFTVIDSPRAVTFRNKYGVQMIMRFNEIHKFSDGTLHQIDEVLDYRVKEFKVNRRNPGLDIQFWTKKDVDRSKEFMFAIQKRLKTRRIFQNLESFVGGRIRDGDYRLLKRTE
ncbi:hypothetical protein Tco_0008170 [Tanacetum coccineum]